MSGSPVATGHPTPIQIPPGLLERIGAEARAAYPAECCGWLTGPRDADAVTAIRPCANAQEAGDNPHAPDRSAETAYVIAGDDLIELSRSIDSPTPARIIYHSHPNGRAYFSETDRVVATSPWGDGPAYPVQQLVVAVDRERALEAALFAWSDESGAFVEIWRTSLTTAARP